jgi:hypothetical protein
MSNSQHGMSPEQAQLLEQRNRIIAQAQSINTVSAWSNANSSRDTMAMPGEQKTILQTIMEALYWPQPMHWGLVKERARRDKAAVDRVRSQSRGTTLMDLDDFLAAHSGEGRDSPDFDLLEVGTGTDNNAQVFPYAQRGGDNAFLLDGEWFRRGYRPWKQSVERQLGQSLSRQRFPLTVVSADVKPYLAPDYPGAPVDGESMEDVLMEFDLKCRLCDASLHMSTPEEGPMEAEDGDLFWSVAVCHFISRFSDYI